MSEEEEAPVLSSHRRATVIRIDVRIQVNRYGSLNVCTYVFSGEWERGRTVGVKRGGN